MTGFLYGQTEYNLLKNSMHLSDYVNMASQKGYKALSITDSNLYGNYKFFKKCIQNDIKPLIGLELEGCIAYALNMEGYSNLLKLSSTKEIDGAISIDVMEKYKRGLYFIVNDYELYKDYKKTLTNVGIGIYKDDIDLYNKAVSEGISVFPLMKVGYLNPEDRIVYETLCKIGNTNSDEKSTYYKDADELNADFNGMEKCFEYFEKLADTIHLDLSAKRASLPSYPLKGDKTSKDYLYTLCMAGLKKRLQDYKGDTKPYLDRIKFELDVIDKMGYSDYFLIVWDFIKYAKNNKILVGPGRGSAAGSLVAYSIGISSVDPLKYGLFFERFLNPERVSMPDIDTDFPDSKREDVIEYVRNLYGADHVCNIGAFGTFKIKSSLRDLGKALGKSDEFIKAISNQVRRVISDENDDMDDKDAIKELITKIDDKDMKEFLSIALRMENLPRHTTTHASGVIVSNTSLYDIVPLQNGSANQLQTQLEATDCEEIGLLKMDFLGIRNLTIIDEVISKIKGLNNINIYNSIPLDDKKTYDMLSSGDTLGIFQFSERGITRTVTNLKPNSFEDIVAVLALYRPGPMKNIPEYIERKNGKKYEYIHPDLEDILKETYGIIVYQEQIMQIARKFAGYTLGEADILRRAVSKKKEEVLIAERDRFVKSSISNGYSKDIANKIYDDILVFADYGFNKSHTVVYGLFSYLMAYFKANYTREFIEALLNGSSGSIDSTIEYISYAKKHQIKIAPPDINISSLKYEFKNGVLYMPLNSAKGVGKNIAEAIVTEREKGLFKSFADFKERAPIPSNALDTLIYAGAFDSFGDTRKSLIDGATGQQSVFDLFLNKKKSKEEEFDDLYLSEKEKEALGFNLLYTIFKGIDEMRDEKKALPLKDMPLNKAVNIIAVFSDTKEVTTKNNTVMLVGRCADDTAELPMVIFPSEYETYKRKIKKGVLYLINGVLKPSREKGNQIVINEIKVA